MVYLFMAMFFLCGFVTPIFGSESNEIPSYQLRVGGEGVKIPLDLLCHNEIRFYASVHPLYYLLCYSDKKYIDSLKQNYGVECNYNEPLIRMRGTSQGSQKLQNLKEQFIDPLTLVPARCFIVGDAIKKDGNVFKPKNATLFLFSVEGEKKPIHIKLDTDLVDLVSINKDRNVGNFEELMERFKTTFLWIYEPGGKKKVTVEEYADLKKELIEAKIITSDEKHGPNSYFAEEIKADLLYFRFKTLFCCSSIIAAIIMYALYKNFYN